MIAILFLIGISFGSFINVLVDRIPAGESIVYGRSHCDYCYKSLSLWDLFPVFSFLFLGGKCRYCHKQLSFQYPLIELLTGILFVVIYLIEQPVFLSQFLFLGIDLLLLSLGLALLLMDLKYQLLADGLLVAFAVCSLIKVFLESPFLIIPHIGIGLLSLIPLLVLFLFSQGKAMGFGDVKLIGILGFLLGFPLIVVDYYVAFLTGAIAGVILIMSGKKNFRTATIAFGPFLLFGSVVASIWGQVLWTYARTFLGF